jgi:hypothetical protein
MSSSNDDAGTLPMSERLTPRQSKRTRQLVNQTPAQSEGTSDNSPPVASKQIRSEDDSDEEVPSSFPIVHPSIKSFDFGEDDDVEETYEETDTSSSDEEGVSLAVIAKKSMAEKRGQKEDNKQGRQDSKELVCIMLCFHYVAPFFHG